MDINLLYKIFIADDAWLTILKGMFVTVEISLLALVFGTILGAVVCFFRMKERRVLSILARAYIGLVRGSHVLMLLMLFYYGLLASSDLPPEFVAVLAFSMHTAAHVAELLRSAISATDYGQVEAARTLGFSKYEAFRLITLPQLFKIARPVYQSTIINLIQWTSVVGYVSITDLTRVIYNTASRTMQPMITILGGMILYLLVSYVVYGIFFFFNRNEEKGGENR